MIDAAPGPVDRNAHVTAYLTYYVGLRRAPHYAVLLDGAWGIGKTFLLKAFLDGLDDPELRSVYVSLNGLASTDEIDDAIFPLLDNRASRLTVRLVNSQSRDEAHSISRGSLCSGSRSLEDTCSRARMGSQAAPRTVKLVEF